MDLGLAGVPCLVTGAGSGMGRACAIALAAEGARVAVVARTRRALEETAALAADAGAADVVVVPADLEDPAAAGAVLDRVVAGCGGLGVLVNAVGLCEPVREGIVAADEEVWRRAFDSVVLLNVRLCQRAVGHMRGNGGGSIVNVAATSIHHHLPVIAHYSAMKSALAHFTRTLAKECGPDGIRVNAVLPGMVESEPVRHRHVEQMAATGQTEQEVFAEANARYGGLTWSTRFGQPADVGDVVAFLSSPRAGYVNGALVPVDGGSG